MLLAFAFTTATIAGFGQEEVPVPEVMPPDVVEPTDTTRFNIGETEFIIIDHDTAKTKDVDYDTCTWDVHPKKRDLTYWTGIDAGVNMLMDWHKTFDQFSSSHLQTDPANSISFSVNFLEQRIRIAKDYLGLVTGLGFTNSRYGFKDGLLHLNATSDSTYGYIDTTLVSSYSTNQLRVNYFNVPLLLQINLSKNPRKNFHVALGVIGSVRMNSNVKYVYESSIGETKFKDKGRFNLSPFQACATARVGFRDFGLFANYHFLSLFEKGKSEAAYPLTFGASFHF